MYSSPPSFLRRPALGISPALENPRLSHNLYQRGCSEDTNHEQPARGDLNKINVLYARDVVHVDEIEHAPSVP